MASVSLAVDARLSCRAFLPRDVPLAVVREILAKAARAPSGGNTQPWHCHVVAGAKREELVAAALRNFEEGNAGDKPEFQMYPAAKASKVYMERRRKLGYDMYSLLGVDKDDTAGRLEAMKANFAFFGAPVGIIVTVDRIVDKNGWGHVGMFIQTVCLLAEEAGLKTCLQEAWSTFNQTCYKTLDIPAGEVVWCGIALGYPDTSAKVNTLRSEREPLDKFATFHGFDTTSKL